MFRKEAISYPEALFGFDYTVTVHECDAVWAEIRWPAGISRDSASVTPSVRRLTRVAPNGRRRNHGRSLVNASRWATP
jgi:hypothetical protein